MAEDFASIFFTASTHPDIGKSFIKLSGTDNYEAWCTAFVDIVNTKGYAKYYTGEYKALAKPPLPPYVDAASQRAKLAAYNAEYERWNTEVWARKAALSLLRCAVADAVWRSLADGDADDSVLAWVALHGCYCRGLSGGSSGGELSDATTEVVAEQRGRRTVNFLGEY